jgi:hypothetical protein
MTATAERQHALVAAFSAGLSVRPDSERIRAILAHEFTQHAGSLWPRGDPAWIGKPIDEIFAVIERLYAQAAAYPTVGALEFLDRLAWLPPLLRDLDRPRLDA